jgi:hypothetical protein
VINISFETRPELYTDYEKCLEFLRTIDDNDYIYPDQLVNFHLYSEVKNDKELLAVTSFFATQNIDKCRLILWSDYDVKDNARLAPFKSLIDFRVFDPIEEAKGTPLDSLTNVLCATDSRHYMISGLLRFLALYKYGGIWYDMDMVLIRDLKPILNQEFAYMWGSETDFYGFGPCAAFMGIQKGSQHATVCLDELIKAPIVPNSVSRDHEMLAKVYRRRPFTVFPSVFFNTEWQINVKHRGLGTAIEGGWFCKTEYSTCLFLEAFAWHWHNSSKKDLVVEPGSKFHLLAERVDALLNKKGL